MIKYKEQTSYKKNLHIFIFSSRVSCRKIVTWKSWRNRFLPTPTFVQLSSVTIFKTSKKKVVFCDLINWNYFYVFKANRIAFSDKKKNGQTSSIRIGICGFMCLNFHSKVMADMRPVYFEPSSCCCLNPVWKIQAENNQMSQTQLKQSAYTNISTEGFLLYPQIQRQCNKVKT